MKAVEVPVSSGLTAARKGFEMGVAALHERDVRRRGLLLSLAFVFVTVAGLWLKIRRIKPGGGH
jgi:hypothetical protein